MSKWREETRTLVCGCKIGRSQGGIWFYDRICEIHLPEVLDKKGHFSYKKSLRLTHRLNKEMGELEKHEQRAKTS